MTSWLEKRNRIFTNSQAHAPKTTETPLMVVMGVCSSRIPENKGRFLFCVMNGAIWNECSLRGRR